MSARVPSFLLGGINTTQNFLGSRTAKTAAYGLVEMTVKIAPVFLVFKLAVVQTKSVVAPPMPAPTQRRSTLT